MREPGVKEKGAKKTAHAFEKFAIKIVPREALAKQHGEEKDLGVGRRAHCRPCGERRLGEEKGLRGIRSIDCLFHIIVGRQPCLLQILECARHCDDSGSGGPGHETRRRAFLHRAASSNHVGMGECTPDGASKARRFGRRGDGHGIVQQKIEDSIVRRVHRSSKRGLRWRARRIASECARQFKKFNGQRHVLARPLRSCRLQTVRKHGSKSHFYKGGRATPRYSRAKS